MKAVIGEYGKIIILAIVLCLLVSFLLGKGDTGFLGMLKAAKPLETVGHEDSFSAAEAIASRARPKLEITTEKLRQGIAYNLLDTAMFRIKAENEDGEKVDVAVIRIINPNEENITDTTIPEHFVPTLAGEYRITYEAKEVYLGSTKTRTKEYRFIAD